MSRSGAEPIWMAAASWAARAHRGQARKDGVTPYVAHPFRVAMIVRDLFGCDDGVAIAAALLHDVIEDTGADYDEIEGEFGSDVADCVAALTKNMALPESARERAYDEQLARADGRARLIKLADTLDNLIDRARRNDAGDPEEPAKSIEKCRRAIELAAKDVGPDGVFGRAIDAVSEAVERYGEP